jgi:hypothetical protein
MENEKSSKNIYKLLFFVTLVLLFLALAFLAGLYYGKGQTLFENSGRSAPGGDKEIKKEHYPIEVKPSETTSSANTVYPTVEAVSDKDGIEAAFAKKYNRPESEVKVTLNESDGTYASGGISFEGEMGGGWFLAFNEQKGEWIIVADGNGTVSCEKIDPYNFPVSMVPECWDEGTQELMQRDN